MKTLTQLYLLEYKKSRRRHLYLVFLGTLLLQITFMFWNMGKSSTYQQGWMAQLYNMPILNAIILPTIMGVYASRLMDIEHMQHNWKLLKTLQSSTRLFLGKLLYGLTHIICFCLGQLTGLFLIGSHYDFPGEIPVATYGLYLANTLLVCFLLFTLQLLLSLCWENQAVGLAIGLCGSLTGLFISFLPRGILYEIIPWGLFCATGTVGMNWDSETHIVDFYFTEPIPGSYLAITLWLALLLFLGKRLFAVYEVDGFSFVFCTSAKTKKQNFVSPKSLSIFPTEWIKLKRSPVWFAFIILPSLAAFVGTFNYLGNLAILQDEWYSLWTQHSLFFCSFFMPALLGVYCSYLWHLEHSGTNWNQLMVHSTPIKIVMSKLSTSLGILGITLIWQLFLFIVSGKIAGIQAPLPRELASWFLCGFIGGAAICSLHILLSLVIRSFALPIVFGIAGGIVGLLCTAKGIWYLLPYSLFSIGMRANNPDMELNLLHFLPAGIIYIGLPFFLSVQYLSKKDVNTES